MWATFVKAKAMNGLAKVAVLFLLLLVFRKKCYEAHDKTRTAYRAVTQAQGKAEYDQFDDVFCFPLRERGFLSVIILRSL